VATDWQPEMLLSSVTPQGGQHTSPQLTGATALSHSARTWNRAKGTLIPVHGTKHAGSRGTAPLILNLGTTWRYVLSFTLQPLYPRIKTRRYITEFEWALQPEWTFWKREHFLTSVWNWTPANQVHNKQRSARLPLSDCRQSC
jgi:hypothetical protein